MRDRLSRIFTTFAVSVVMLSAHAGSALTIESGTSFLEGPSTIGCTSGTGCFPGFPTVVYTIDGAAEVLGSISLDVSASTLSFDLSVADATFSGSDGAVSGVAFSPVRYVGTVDVVDSGIDFDVVDQLADVSGSLTALGPNSSELFALSGVELSGSCLRAGNGALACGLTFGPESFVVDVAGNDRYFQHRLNINVVPEPGTALLLGIGLAVLGQRRRGVTLR